MTEKNSLPGYKWIKVPIDYLDDPDFMGMSDSTAGAFVKLYLLAGKADAGGLLCNGNKVFGLNDLTWRIRSEMTILKAAINEMLTAGLLVQDGDGFKITRFLDEQGPGDEAKRIQWREWQRRHREKAEDDSLKDKKRPKTQTRQRQEGQPDVMKCQADKDKNQSPSPLGLMVEALSQVTGLDLTLNYPRLAKEGKDLQEANYTPAQVLQVYSSGGAWWTVDWRGKRGESPQIGLIRSTIAQLLSKKSNGRQPVLEAQTPEQTKDLLDELQRPDGDKKEGKSGY